jgi:hypothetical protein
MKNTLRILLGTALLSLTLLVASSPAQVSIEFGRRPRVDVVVVEQPVCLYGYYDFEPYACAPYGFYGDGYFYDGIFLGVGPWANWGYEHGWGERRFEGSRGGQYRGEYRGHEYRGDRVRSHGNDNRGRNMGRNQDHGRRNSGHANERHNH